MAKGLGNNPLGAGLGNTDPLIRDTTKHGTGLGPVSPEPSKPAKAGGKKPVLKSFSFPDLLNERLRTYCFDKRKKEAEIVREALHRYLAEQGY